MGEHTVTAQDEVELVELEVGWRVTFGVEACVTFCRVTRDTNRIHRPDYGDPIVPGALINASLGGIMLRLFPDCVIRRISEHEFTQKVPLGGYVVVTDTILRQYRPFVDVQFRVCLPDGRSVYRKNPVVRVIVP